MAGLYTLLTVVRVIAFYGLLWYITGNSFRYLVLKKEHEGKTKHLIKTKTVVISVLLGLCFCVGNIGLSALGEKVYAEKRAKEELVSKLDYEKNFSKKVNQARNSNY